MNFNLLRYTAVFSGAFLVIHVLGIIEMIWLLLSLESDFSNCLGTKCLFLRLGSLLGPQVLDQLFLYLSLVYLAAFAIAALAEGRRYHHLNSSAPSSINMLSGSVAMAVIGMGVTVFFVVLYRALISVQLSLQEILFTSWGLLLSAALLVIASIICRIFFGIGLRQARQRRSVSEGAQS